MMPIRVSYFIFAVAFILGAKGVLGADSTPSPPQWPDQFVQNFTETSFWASGWYQTEGTFYYDWTNKKMSIEKESGMWDRLCASEYPDKDTPCTHYVDSGDRYLYFPEMKTCCYCCNSSDTCDMKSPDWLKDANYVNTFFVHSGDTYIKAYKWENKPHYYYETTETEPEDRTMVEWQNIPIDALFFKLERSLSVSSNMVDLPSICAKDKTCSKGDICNNLD
ncbi:uncharacterized protein LOC142343927 [Convolutriloba macropyga]|uniref:uncharacterized protein LOC142343927 n=1 Tax=Convolutriloba macropyga TaxID=536237 RepID=UPI003F51E6C2